MARYVRQAAPGEKLRGELLEFTVRSADFWGTGVLRTKHDGGHVTIAGKVVGAKPGDTVDVEGWWDTHARYGRQFKVRSVEVVIPQDVGGVVGWLAAKLPQISRRRAEELVARFGVDGTWSVLDRGDVEALTGIDGITEPRAREILAAYRAEKGDRDRVVRLKSWGLTDGQIARVIDTWGDDAEAKLQANPYLLIEHVDGFGWSRADAVAMRMGVRGDSPARLAAGLVHAMNESVTHGNCYVPGGKLVAMVAGKVCGVEESPVRKALEGLVEAGKLVRRGTGIYLPQVASAEEQLAKTFAERAKRAREAGAA